MATVLETSRPRPGRRFEPTHEKALYENALSACTALPGAYRGLIVIREMTGPIGIPDLTALVGSQRALEERRAFGAPPLLNQLDAAIVAAAHTRIGRPLEAIAAQLGWPVTTVRRRLPALLDSDVLSWTTRRGLRRHHAMQPLGRLFAVEAKVRDRGAAVHQARSYGSWADGYVLVMGELGSRPLAQVLTDVDEDEGGLMMAGRWLRRPKVSSLPDSRRLLGSEYFYAAVANGTYHPSVVA